MFRESLRGFNKDDVSAYIMELGSKYSVKAEEYKQQNKNLEIEFESFKSKMDENLKLNKSELDRLTADVSSAEERIARLSDELSAKNSEIEKLSSELSALKISPPTEIFTAPVVDENSKSKEMFYKTASLNLGKVIFNAEKTAEDVITEATAHANEIVAAAQQRAAQYKSEVTSKKALSEKQHEDFVRLTENLLREFKTNFEIYIKRLETHTNDLSAVLEPPK